MTPFVLVSLEKSFVKIVSTRRMQEIDSTISRIQIKKVRVFLKMNSAPEIVIRECTRIEEFDACVNLQRKIFALPDLEISPRRHLIVTKNAGGFTLGAFAENELIGFVLSVAGFSGGAERFFYSHMTAVAEKFQNRRVGARLKWAQRERALSENVKFIKWTFQPAQARNAFFNLERLGVVIKSYAANFYGTDYSTSPNQTGGIGLDSDRLFAEWHLESEKVKTLADGEKFAEKGEAVKTIEIPAA
jgi:predicted GNAT superfamily acetyltransferase